MNEDPILQQHIENLKHENWQYVCRDAAQALAKIGSPRAIDALIEALKDGIAPVRYYAAEALGKIKDAHTVDALVEALKDEHHAVRGQAAYELGNIKDPETVIALIETLQDEDAAVRSYAAGALGKIQDTRAVPALIEALKDNGWNTLSTSPVHSYAADALKAIGNSKTLPRKILLEKSFSGQQRAEILDDLRKINYKDFRVTLRYRFPDTQTLCQMLQQSDDQNVRAAGTEVLVWWKENGDLLRAGPHNTETDGKDLLRTVTGWTGDTRAETLLRPSEDAPTTQPTPPQKKSLRERLRSRLKREKS